MIEKITSLDGVSNLAADAFSRDLTELTHRHKIGIVGSPTLFLLTVDDHSLRYLCDEDSALILDHAHR